MKVTETKNEKIKELLSNLWTMYCYSKKMILRQTYHNDNYRMFVSVTNYKGVHSNIPKLRDRMNKRMKVYRTKFFELSKYKNEKYGVFPIDHSAN